jgi:hypothetical protein
MISNKSILKLVISASIAFFFAPWMQAASAPERSQEEIMKAYVEKYVNRSRKQKILDIAASIVLAPLWASTIVHEYGHALPNKFLTGDPINIHLGASGGEVPDIIATKPGRLGITVHSIRPGFAFSSSTTPLRKKSHEIMMIASGPLVELAFLWGMNRIVNKFDGKWNQFLHAYIKIVLWFGIVNAFIYGLTPINLDSGDDGYRIWELLGVSKKILDKFVRFGQLLSYK